jgi:t-SNARE complex subunit (syntaxin)
MQKRDLANAKRRVKYYKKDRDEWRDIANLQTNLLQQLEELVDNQREVIGALVLDLEVATGDIETQTFH